MAPSGRDADGCSGADCSGAIKNPFVSGCLKRKSAEYTGDQVPALSDAGETFLASEVFEVEFVGLDSESGEDGCVQVVYGLRRISSAQADFVGGSDDMTGLNTTAGHPNGKPVGIRDCVPDCPASWGCVRILRPR